MVLDEAHKLLDVARQMYSIVWDEQEAELILKLSTVNVRVAGIDELAMLSGQGNVWKPWSDRESGHWRS